MTKPASFQQKTERHLRGAILQLFSRGTDAHIAEDYKEEIRLDGLADRLRFTLASFKRHGALHLGEREQEALDEAEGRTKPAPKAPPAAKPTAKPRAVTKAAPALGPQRVLEGVLELEEAPAAPSALLLPAHPAPRRSAP